MVQDLQVGFTAAMTELSNIQDEDKKLYDKLSDSKQEQEVQMRDVLQLVQTLKVCTCFPDFFTCGFYKKRLAFLSFLFVRS